AWDGRPRMRRGGVRRAILWALSEGPAHGYEVMRRLEERSAGAWRPSPGSVYPTLQLLEDQGLVRSTSEGGTRTYELTDAAPVGCSPPTPPLSAPGPDADSLRSLHEAVTDVRAAVRQLTASGREHQLARATEIFKQARKELYQLLADG
ncbi:MAG: helix-turn-helix transcriptional regulator, partial [Acidimicrobiales bacterium]